jgi:replication initiation and membrane attachment protein DnaB
MGGLNMEIKSMVKILKPKALKQTCNLARLQKNTLSYHRNHHNNLKHSTYTMTQTSQSRFNQHLTPNKNKCSMTINTSNSHKPGLLTTPT